MTLIKKCDVCMREIKLNEKYACITISYLTWKNLFLQIESQQNLKVYDICNKCYDRLANKLPKLLKEIIEEKSK